MTSRRFRECLDRRAAHAAVAVSSELGERLEIYFRLLARWNQKINLTAFPTDDPTDETFDRLFIEPLAAARHIEDSWTPWFDLGSGGGSPAIPLKLARPDLVLTMVESKARKAAFLREAVRTLGLVGTSVVNVRFEELPSSSNGAGSAGLVTARAVRTDRALVECAAQLLSADGRLLLFRRSSTAAKHRGLIFDSSAVLIPSPKQPAHLLIYRRMFHVEQSCH